MAIIPIFFFTQYSPENVFYDILERTNPFLGFKNKNFESLKIEISPKGLTYGFGPKMAIF